jgi:hypothetical protein
MPKDMTKNLIETFDRKEHERQEARLVMGFIAIAVIFLAVGACGAVMITRAIIGG